MTAQSSKSLFRATKAKPKRDDRQSSIDGLTVQMRPTDNTRRADDFYPTGQPEAIRALFARDGARIQQFDGVWEPAVGDGALAREIEGFGMPCVASDLVDRGWPGTTARSFYAFQDSPAEAIITNPPFSEINARDGHGRRAGAARGRRQGAGEGRTGEEPGRREVTWVCRACRTLNTRWMLLCRHCGGGC